METMKQLILRKVGGALALLMLTVAVGTQAVLPASPGSVPGGSGTSLKLPPMVPERSVSFYIPSAAAPAPGLAVNVIYPPKPRYADGAPIVVVVPGGEESSGLDFSMHAAQAGFVEVRFAFPGGGKEGFRSAGTYDSRGQVSQVALRDVLLFASGKLNDSKGRPLSQIVPVKINTNNLGAVGWSNGGNTLLVTLSKFGAGLKNISWLAFYETPLGAMFYPPFLGGATDFVANRHYRQGSAATGEAAVDFRKLRWQADATKKPGSHKKIGQPEIPGVLFFDENGNKVWEESFEFALPYACAIGYPKQVYPPQVTTAMERLKVFGDKWPDYVANLSESQAFFAERDGSKHLKAVAKAMPQLMVTIFGSQIDHLQIQPDHPHLPMQYNGWIASGAKWTRLNPDPVYVGQAAGMNARNFPSNTPNSSIDASAIEQHLEPEGIVPDFIYMDAAISEMADRKKQNNYTTTTLIQPLVTHNYGATPPPPPPEK